MHEILGSLSLISYKLDTIAHGYNPTLSTRKQDQKFKVTPGYIVSVRQVQDT